MASETITLKLIATDLASGNISKAIAGIDKMAQRGGILGSVFQGVGLSIGQMLNPVALVTRAIGTVTDIMGDAMTAAAEEEEAISRLTTAIEANDVAWDGNIDAVEAVIDTRKDLAFSDDEQRTSLARLVSATKDVTEALDLQRVAMDLARLRGMDLSTSSDLIGKVYSGNIGILSRYGIQLEKGTTATEALAEIQKRARGQAESYADTTQGKLTRAQIALDDAMEELGASLLPIVGTFAEMAADVLPDVTEGFHNLWRAVNVAGAEQEDLRDAARRVSSALGIQADVLEDIVIQQDKVRRATEAQARVNVIFKKNAEGLTKLQEQELDNMVRIADQLTAQGRKRNDVVKEMAYQVGMTYEAADAIVGEELNIRKMITALLLASQSTENAADATEGLTEAEKTAIRAGQQYIMNQARIEAIMRRQPEVINDVADATDETTRDIVRSWTWAGTEVGRLVGQWPGTIKDTIKGGKDEVREAMADLRWAMERPFADEEFAKWLAKRADAALEMMERAIRQGRPELVAEAAATRIAILEQLNIADPGAGTREALRQRRREGGLGGDAAGRRSGGGRDRGKAKSDEMGFTSAVLATADAHDKAAAATDRHAQATERGKEAAERFKKRLDDVREAAARISDAFQNIANVDFLDMRESGDEALAELRESLEAQVNPLQVIQDEVAQLKALRAEAEAQGRYDIMAAIDLRLQELKVMREQYGLMQKRYTDEHSALDLLHEKLDISIKKARELLETYRRKTDIGEDVTDEELARIIIRLRNQRAAGGPVVAGQSYLVGERGPEMFTPTGAGYVTPNGGGGSFVYAPTFSSASPAEAQRFAMAITPFIERERRRIA